MEITEKHYLGLLEESFPGIRDTIIRCDALGFPWEASTLFIREENGQALSHVALLECPILIKGQWHNIGALHGICTRKTHQGQGLATELIEESLIWAKERCEAIILFTEIPIFYEKLAFEQVQEYRFHIHRSAPAGTWQLEPLSLPKDKDLFIRCFAEREPLSNHVWIRDNGSIASFNTLFATYPDFWSLYYNPVFDGFISFILENKTMHLFDVIAKKLPSIDVILDHMPAPIDDIYCYFSPDKLIEGGTPEPYLYDKGHLMIHGSLQLPNLFMISPLSRC